MKIGIWTNVCIENVIAKGNQNPLSRTFKIQVQNIATEKRIEPSSMVLESPRKRRRNAYDNHTQNSNKGEDYNARLRQAYSDEDNLLEHPSHILACSPNSSA